VKQVGFEAVSNTNSVGGRAILPADTAAFAAETDGTALPAPPRPCNPKSNGDLTRCQFEQKRVAPLPPSLTWNP